MRRGVQAVAILRQKIHLAFPRAPTGVRTFPTGGKHYNTSEHLARFRYIIYLMLGKNSLGIPNGRSGCVFVPHKNLNQAVREISEISTIGLVITLPTYDKKDYTPLCQKLQVFDEDVTHQEYFPPLN